MGVADESGYLALRADLAPLAEGWSVRGTSRVHENGDSIYHHHRESSTSIGALSWNATRRSDRGRVHEGIVVYSRRERGGPIRLYGGGGNGCMQIVAIFPMSGQSGRGFVGHESDGVAGTATVDGLVEGRATEGGPPPAARVGVVGAAMRWVRWWRDEVAVGNTPDACSLVVLLAALDVVGAAWREGALTRWGQGTILGTRPGVDHRSGAQCPSGHTSRLVCGHRTP